MRAVAADGVTVHDERVRQQLRAGAVLVCALRTAQPVANDRAVAVFQAGLAFPTFHAPFIAPEADNFALPRRTVTGLGPAQFVQPIVVDTEVVGDLVHHGDLHFFDDLLVVIADVQQRVAVDGDGVR